jgi:DNA polymerase I
MSKIVFDIEADNLLENVSQVWCICTLDILTDECKIGVADQHLHLESSVELIPIQESIRILRDASILIGHNIMGYDLHLIEKFFGLSLFHKKIRDTLCMSKLFNPERISHSLESYGIQFDRHKVVHEEWNQISSEMLLRCSEDVQINALTYQWMVDKYCKDWDWLPAIELEQEFQYWQVMQEMEGVYIDQPLARDLIVRIDKEIQEIDTILLQRLPKRCVPIGEPIQKPFKKDGTYIKKVEEWINK